MTVTSGTIDAQRLTLFRACFSGLEHAYGTYDLRTGRAFQVKRRVTDQVLCRHILGEQPYGVYLLVNDRTRAAVADFDKPDPWPVLEFIEQARQYGITAYTERSKSKGWHVWVFTSSAGVLAAKVRAVMRRILGDIDEPAVEIFPKQDRLAGPTSFGNFVYAPLFGRLVPEGRTVFVDPYRGFEPVPDQWALLASIERASEAQLDELIDLNDWAPQQDERRSAPATIAPGPVLSVGLPPCARRMLADGVTENQRMACFWLAVQLRKAGLPLDLAAATLGAWARKNRPSADRRRITPEEIDEQTHWADARPYRSCGCENEAVQPYCDPSCPVRRSVPSRTCGWRTAPDVTPSCPGGVVEPLDFEERSTPVVQRASQRPIKEFRAGPVKVAIWQNEAEQNGQRVIRHSVRIGKRYFDRQQNAWLDSDYFFVNDLPRLRLLVEKAFEFIALKESDPDSAETPDGASPEPPRAV